MTIGRLFLSQAEKEMSEISEEDFTYLIKDQLEEIYAYNGKKRLTQSKKRLTQGKTRLTQSIPSDDWKISKELFIELIKDKKKFIQNNICANPSTATRTLRGLFSNFEIIITAYFGDTKDSKVKALQYLDKIYLENSGK